MALILNQVAIPVSGTGAVLIGTIPPNSVVTLSVPTGGQTVYVGQATTVSSTSGFPINPGGPQVNFTLPPTSQTVTLFAINGSAATPTALGFAVQTTA